tara:strand:- start:574 stop:2235 length:1662 start_codon:yes stop_codon:yes gene_type:complete
MADELETTIENLTKQLNDLTNQLSNLKGKDWAAIGLLNIKKRNLEDLIKLEEEKIEVETSTLEAKKEILEDLNKGSQSLGVLANKLKGSVGDSVKGFQGFFGSMGKIFDQSPFALLGGTFGLMRKGRTGQRKIMELFMDDQRKNFLTEQRKEQIGAGRSSVEESRAGMGFFENFGHSLGNILTLGQADRLRRKEKDSGEEEIKVDNKILTSSEKIHGALTAGRATAEEEQTEEIRRENALLKAIENLKPSGKETEEDKKKSGIFKRLFGWIGKAFGFVGGTIASVTAIPFFTAFGGFLTLVATIPLAGIAKFGLVIGAVTGGIIGLAYALKLAVPFVKPFFTGMVKFVKAIGDAVAMVVQPLANALVTMSEISFLGLLKLAGFFLLFGKTLLGFGISSMIAIPSLLALAKATDSITKLMDKLVGTKVTIFQQGFMTLGKSVKDFAKMVSDKSVTKAIDTLNELNDNPLLNKLLTLGTAGAQFGTTSSQTVGQLLAMYKDKAISEATLREGLNLLQTNIITNSPSTSITNAFTGAMSAGNQALDNNRGANNGHQ